MEAGILLQEIRNSGLEIQAIDGDLHIRPRHLITDAIRQSIRAHKKALVDYTLMTGNRMAQEYRLYHLPENWPLPWCWFAVLEPEYVKEFSELCPLPANEIYVSGHRTKEAALQYGDKALNDLTKGQRT